MIAAETGTFGASELIQGLTIETPSATTITAFFALSPARKIGDKNARSVSFAGLTRTQSLYICALLSRIRDAIIAPTPPMSAQLWRYLSDILTEERALTWKYLRRVAYGARNTFAIKRGWYSSGDITPSSWSYALTPPYFKSCRPESDPLIQRTGDMYSIRFTLQRYYNLPGCANGSHFLTFFHFFLVYSHINRT